ncbi:glycosyltransferase family 4 protein [Nostoc sp. CCY0012]|uniref:glycosyltransferase family 4 protein n=1 Tax=Nostoc sp. CCY0012 TaxID=1056123 RepID=UPI0039C674C5
MSYKLAYFVSHPIQYQAPLLCLIAAKTDIELKVFFYSDFSLKAYQDSGFGQYIQWDVPLTEGYDYQFLKCWGSKQPTGMLRQAIATDILQQLKLGKFDAVWVHGWSQICGLQAISAAQSLGIPVFMRGESNGLQEPNNPVKKFFKDVFLKILFQKISGFLCIGTLNYKFYQSYGINQNKLFWMPYAVDNDYFQNQATLAQANREQLRRSLNLTPGRPIILYAARLADAKRPQDLLEAYRLLSSDGVQEPEPYLLFVGDGALRSQLESAAKATNWQSIRFLGFRNQSELPAFYNLCDVFVLPSSFEPWGLVVNEVMNAAKPVIASDQVGAAVDLVKDGENGYIFPVGSVTELAEFLKRTLNNPDNARQMGERSLAMIQNWSFTENYTALLKALHTVSVHT